MKTAKLKPSKILNLKEGDIVLIVPESTLTCYSDSGTINVVNKNKDTLYLVVDDCVKMGKITVYCNSTLFDANIEDIFKIIKS